MFDLSYRHAQASLVAPFEYPSILFALLIGYTVFHEVPTVQMLIGVAIIVAAGLVIIWREAQIELEHSCNQSQNTSQLSLILYSGFII